jgi:hypothetical protein
MHGRTIILLIVAYGLVESTLAVHVNFTQCFADIRAGVYGPYGGTDANGNPLSNISDAVGITYALCKTACETGPEPFAWTSFSQKFSSWLLPSLALLSQLPFGAGDMFENLTSVVLAVGSPTLAGYSLILTALNGLWVAQRFSDISYPNVDRAFRIMINLQQAPLNIINEHGLLQSLVVLPENDKWWEELAVWLDFTHTWSISAAASIIWVFLAYLFTVIDAFSSLPPNPVANSDSSDGQSVGTVWLWLLPVVGGWLQISPKCDILRLGSALSRANTIAYVAAPEGPAVVDCEAWAFTMDSMSDDAMHADEKCTAPIFNYARLLPWTQNVEEVVAVFRHASDNAREHKRVDALPEWVEGSDESQVQSENRRGNLEQVIHYCTSSSSEIRSRWGPNVWSRMLIASLIALSLQWSTAGAAIIIVWYSPTVGLGCRSGSYLLYAAASTISWMLLVASSIVTHFLASSKYRVSPRLRNFGIMVAVGLRRMGKTVATYNAIWIILVCIFQFNNFYDRCYCNSSVTGLKGSAYDTIIGGANELAGPWIGGVTLACGSAFMFIFFVNLCINPQPTSRSP